MRLLLVCIVGAALVPLLFGTLLVLACPDDDGSGPEAEGHCDHCLACFQSHGHGLLVALSRDPNVVLLFHGTVGAHQTSEPESPFRPGIDHPPHPASC